MRIAACLLAVLCAARGRASRRRLSSGRSSAGSRRATSRDECPRAAPNASMSCDQHRRHVGVRGRRAGRDRPARRSIRRDRGGGIAGSVWGSAGERTSSSQAQQEARRTRCSATSSCSSTSRSTSTSPRWRSERSGRASRTSRTRAPKPAGPIRFSRSSSQADRDLQEEQQRYDRETAHGINARAQDQWKRRIQALLN